MVRRPPTRSAVVIATVLLVLLIGWTAATLTAPGVAEFERRLLARPLDPGSALAQIAGAFALLTWPGLTYAALAGVAIWAYQHRLRQLAIALLMIIALGWGGATLFRLIVARPRPEQALDLITATGYSYPSGHLTSAVAAGIAVSATFAVTRQSVRARLAWNIAGSLLVIAVGLDRWVLSAHWVGDLVGGALFGAFVATCSLIVAGVKVPVPHEIVGELVRARTPEPAADTPLRAAVIFNPAKVRDWVTFRRHVEYELSSRGWQRAMWLETTPEDPGRAMTEHAVREQVDLVLGAGGDGTIRVICAGLAGTGIPFGLIPAGTGNLLARNIGIPLDEAAALDVAFDGVDRPIDLVRITVDDEASDYFAVMGGIGIDAVIMEATRPELKKAVGSAAYFVAAAQNAKHPALQATITVDDGEPLRRRAHLIVVGNVGFLQANIPLLPDAQPDDGLIDLLVASPRRPADWVRLTAQVLARRDRDEKQLDRVTGRRIRVRVDQPNAYQMDGDTVGTCSTMTFEVVPGALILRTPRPLG